MTDHGSEEATDIVSTMHWLHEAGVTAILADTPQNRFAAPKPVPAAKPIPPAATTRVTAGQKPAPKTASSTLAQVAQAQEIAQNCADLAALRSAMQAFDGCALKDTATQLVFADGTSDAALMIIGEAPGRDEDIKGLPFVGAAGQLLDKILLAAGMKRGDVYITNIVPWRPPGNRKPTPLETQICLPFIKRHIELVNPDMLLLLGGTPATTLTERVEGITRLRGRWHDIAISDHLTLPALPTFHPAYLLRQPAHKGMVWDDMLKLKEKLAA